MHLETIKSNGLSHNSYFLFDENEAVVVDPRRDCEIYKQIADKNCVKIRHILETHKNEDYVSGSIELKNITDAKIGHSKQNRFGYGDHNFSDEDNIQIGNLKIKILHTPGHTNDSLCYVVYSLTNQKTPLLVFSGDTLFSGDVGRTDLIGKDNQREQSAKLFESLKNKLRPLGKHVIVYPAHGGGSVCGHNISDRETTTIGYEWKNNPLLQIDKKEFINRLDNIDLLRPKYFEKMEELNLQGPPLIKNLPNYSMSIKEFSETTKSDKTVIVDTREAGSFSASHIPGSINIWLEGLSVFPGWILSYDQTICLLHEDKEEFLTAKNYLHRLGFDNIKGYLCSGIKLWRESGKEITNFGTLSAHQLKKQLNKKDSFLLDVRSPQEWKEFHIKGTKNIYVGFLQEELKNLDKSFPIIVMCSVGDRAAIAASILKRAGFSKVFNVLGGISAWKNLNYPLIKE